MIQCSLILDLGSILKFSTLNYIIDLILQRLLISVEVGQHPLVLTVKENIGRPKLHRYRSLPTEGQTYTDGQNVVNKSTDQSSQPTSTKVCVAIGQDIRLLGQGIRHPRYLFF